MKILLLDPPGKNKGLNTGLGYLSAMLKDHHEVRVLDLNNIEIGICGDPNPDLPIKGVEERVNRALEEFNPDLFGISVKTFTAGIAKHIFDLVKEKRPGIITIAGGPHVTLDGLKFVQDSKIDFAIMGEGEFAIVDLCTAINKKDGFAHIGGLIYWNEGQVIQNPGSSKIADLDSLPFPCYDTFSSVIDNSGCLPEYPVLTSRGCPYKCTYCSMPQIMGNKWRYRSPEKVVEELWQKKDKYGNTCFAVVDDNFTLNLKRVDTVCDLLISAQLNLAWNCQNGIRADRLGEDLAAKMKLSGCRYVWIGIENADEKVFNWINKGEKLEDIEKGIRYLKKAGIRVGGFFIVGLPHSTREADLKSVDFVKRNGIDAWWFNFVPYPHTEAWEWVKENAKILRSPEGVLQYGTSDIKLVFETDDYSEAERIKTFKDINYRMGYFHCLFDHSAGQFSNIKRLFWEIVTDSPAMLFPFVIFLIKTNIKSVAKNLRGN
ncbi:MAG TPA: radical SAM protein [Nitrospirae bacterium]|nr:radical SAM protein [Nitrospirota bacterium]